MVVAGEEIDDIVQETYLNIARLKSVEHIRDGSGYLFTAARMVMFQRIRRNRIVRNDHLSAARAMALEEDAHGQDRNVDASRDTARVTRIISDYTPPLRVLLAIRRLH